MLVGRCLRVDAGVGWGESANPTIPPIGFDRGPRIVLIVVGFADSPHPTTELDRVDFSRRWLDKEEMRLEEPRIVGRKLVR